MKSIATVCFSLFLIFPVFSSDVVFNQIMGKHNRIKSSSKAGVQTLLQEIVTIARANRTVVLQNPRLQRVVLEAYFDYGSSQICSKRVATYNEGLALFEQIYEKKTPPIGDLSIKALILQSLGKCARGRELRKLKLALGSLQEAEKIWGTILKKEVKVAENLADTRYYLSLTYLQNQMKKECFETYQAGKKLAAKYKLKKMMHNYKDIESWIALSCQ